MPIVPKSELDNLAEKIITIGSTGLKQHRSSEWCKMRKYGKQNYAELAMQRYKRIIGNKMHSKDIIRQKNEAIIGASILNKITAIGMPTSVRVA